MKYRSHRGLLEDSMATVVEIEASLFALADLLHVEPNRITVEPYCYDQRIDWDTYIVCVDGAPWGFTDSALKS